MTKTVGWREWIALPDIGIKAIKCKVDTGAKNSAIHAFEIEPYNNDGQDWVRFWVHVDETDLAKVQECEARVVDVRSVMDSSGNTSERFFIKTQLVIGEQSFLVDLSLTSRDTMKYNMLLGRTALRKGQLIVDASQSYLQGKIQ